MNMGDNVFTREYFTSYLQECCGLSEEKDDGDKCLIKISNITIGHVVAAHSVGTFTDHNILQWIRKGRKLTPLIQNQFEFYRKLAKYLISSVVPEDVDAWKENLKGTKYVWPTEGNELWASIFGELSNCSLPEDLLDTLIQSEGEKSCDDKTEVNSQFFSQSSENFSERNVSETIGNMQQERSSNFLEIKNMCKDIITQTPEEDSEKYIPGCIGDIQVKEDKCVSSEIEDKRRKNITQSSKDSEKDVPEYIEGKDVYQEIDDKSKEIITQALEETSMGYSTDKHASKDELTQEHKNSDEVMVDEGKHVSEVKTNSAEMKEEDEIMLHEGKDNSNVGTSLDERNKEDEAKLNEGNYVLKAETSLVVIKMDNLLNMESDELDTNKDEVKLNIGNEVSKVETSLVERNKEDEAKLDEGNDVSKAETNLDETKKDDLVNKDGDEEDNSDSEAFGSDFFENDFFSDENDECDENKEKNEKCIEEEKEILDAKQQECEKSKEEDNGNIEEEELDYDENIESEDKNVISEFEKEKEEDKNVIIESDTEKGGVDPDFLQIHVDDDYSDLVPEDEMRNSQNFSSKTHGRKQSLDESESSKTQIRQLSSDESFTVSSKSYNEKQSYGKPSASSKKEQVPENFQDHYSALLQSHLATIAGASEKKITHYYVITESHNKSVLSRVFKWWLPNHDVILVDKVLDTDSVYGTVKRLKSLYSPSKVERGLWIILPSIYSIVTPKNNLAKTPIPTLSNITFDWESSDVIVDIQKTQEKENKRLSSIVSHGKDLQKKLSEILGRNHMVVLAPPIPATVCGVSTEVMDVIRVGKLSVAFEKFTLKFTEMARKIYLHLSPVHDIILNYQTKSVKFLKDSHNDSLDTHYKSWEMIFEKVMNSCKLSGDDPITKFNHVIVVGHQLAVTKLKKLLNANTEFYKLHINFEDVNSTLESMKKLPLEKTNTLWIIPTDVSNWIPRRHKLITTQTIERVLKKSDFPKKALKFVDKLREKLGKDSSVLLTPMVPQTFLFVPQGSKPSDKVMRVSDEFKLMIVEQHGRYGSTSLSTWVQSAHKLWMSRDSPVEHAINKQHLPSFLYKEYLKQMLKYDGGTVEIMKNVEQGSDVPKGYLHWQDYISAIVKFIYRPMEKKSTLYLSKKLRSESKKISELYNSLSIEVGIKYLGELNSFSSINQNGFTDIFVILDSKSEKYLAPLDANFQEIINSYRKPTINWIIEKDLSAESFKSTVDRIIEEADNSLIVFIPMHTDSYIIYKNIITTLVQDLMKNPLKLESAFLVSPPIPSYSLNGNKQFITQNYMISNTKNWISFGQQLCKQQTLFSEVMKVSAESMSKSVENIPLFSLLRAEEEFFPCMQSWYEMMLSMFFIEIRPSSNDSTKLRDFKKFVIIGDQDVEEGVQWKTENTVYKDMSIKLASPDYALDTFKTSLSEHLESKAILFIIIIDSTPWLTPQSFCNQMRLTLKESNCSENLKMYGILNMADAEHQAVHIKNYIKKTKEFVKKAQAFIHPESAIIVTPIIPQSLLCPEEKETELGRLHHFLHKGPKKKLFQLFHPKLESNKVVSYINTVDAVWSEGVKQIMEMQKIPSELVDVYRKRCSKISTATINCKDFYNDIRQIPAYPHWLGLINAYARLLSLGPERKRVEEAVEKKGRIQQKQGTERKSAEIAIETSHGSVLSKAGAIGAILQHCQPPTMASTNISKDFKAPSLDALPMPSVGVSSGSIPAAWVSTFSTLPLEARSSGPLSVPATKTSITSAQPAMGIQTPKTPYSELSSTWIQPPGIPPNVVHSSLIGPLSISKTPIMNNRCSVQNVVTSTIPGMCNKYNNLNNCTFRPCAYPHRCDECGGEHPRSKCIQKYAKNGKIKGLLSVPAAMTSNLSVQSSSMGPSSISATPITNNQHSGVFDTSVPPPSLPNQGAPLPAASTILSNPGLTSPVQETKREKEHWYQDLDTEAESSIKRYIQSAEDKHKTPSVNIKDISEKVNDAKLSLSIEIAKVKIAFAKKAKEFELAQSKNVKEKMSQSSCSKNEKEIEMSQSKSSKSPERINKRSRSRSPNRRNRSDNKNSERGSRKIDQKDKRIRRSDSRSPDRRYRRSRSANMRDRKSRSRSTERRCRKSRSRERIKKESGKRERSPVREKSSVANISSGDNRTRSPSRTIASDESRLNDGNVSSSSSGIANIHKGVTNVSRGIDVNRSSFSKSSNATETVDITSKSGSSKSITQSLGFDLNAEEILLIQKVLGKKKYVGSSASPPNAPQRSSQETETKSESQIPSAISGMLDESRSPNRRRRLDNKNSERGSRKIDQKDKRIRRADSRSPDRRYKRSRSADMRDRKSRSRSTERRSRKSRSRERIKKESGKKERSPVREKRVCSRSPSRISTSNKKGKSYNIKKQDEISNILSENELSETDIAISDSDKIRVIAILTPIFNACGGKQLFCDSYTMGFRFKTKQRARVVYKLLNKFRTPLGRAQLKCSQKVDLYLPKDSQESMLVMGIINESLKKSQDSNVEVFNKLATQKDKLDPYLFKTKKCMFIGNCINKKKCICYHNEEQVRRNPAKIEYLPKLCSEHQLGSCREGNACTSCHSKYELIFHPEKVHKKVCSSWYERGPCKLDYDSPDCCIYAHPETPEVFFNDVWRDMYIADLKHTYQYLVGAIHNLRLVNTQRQGVYLLLVTPSIYMIHWLIGATLNLTKALKLVVHMVTNETAITEKEKHSKVLFCTPGGIIRLLDKQGVNLSHTLAGVILDDVTLLLHQNKGELATIGKALMSSSLGLCRVAVADKLYKEDVSNLSEMFFTNFKNIGTISPPNQDKGLPSSATIDSILSFNKNKKDDTLKDKISSSKNSRQDERPKGVTAHHRKEIISKPHKNPNEFSAVEACSLLMGFCDKVGILGHSLKAVLQKTHKYGNDSQKVIESLSDSESQELLVLIGGKFKRLREETQDPMLLGNIIKACIATNTLIEYTKMYLETLKMDKQKLPTLLLESEDNKDHAKSKGAYQSSTSSSFDKIERHESVNSSKKNPSRTYESIISSIDHIDSNMVNTMRHDTASSSKNYPSMTYGRIESGASNMNNTVSMSTIKDNVSDLSKSSNVINTSKISSVPDYHNIIDQSNIANISNAPSKSITDSYNIGDRGKVTDLIDERLRHILQKTINGPDVSIISDSYNISNRSSVDNFSSADNRTRSPRKTIASDESRLNDGNVSSSSSCITSKPGSSKSITQGLGFDLNAEDILLLQRILGKTKGVGSSASPPNAPQRSSQETETKSESQIPSAISGMLDEIGEPMDLDIGVNLPQKNLQMDSGGECRVNDPTLYLQNPGPSHLCMDSSPKFISGIFKVALLGHEFIDMLPFHSGETFTSKAPDNPYQVIKYVKKGAEIFKIHEYSIFKDVISAQPDMIFLILGKHDISTYISPTEIAERMIKIKNVLERSIKDVCLICFGLENRQLDSGWSSYQDKLNRCLGAGFETVIFPTAQVDIGNNSYESVRRVWSYMQGFIDDIHLQQIMLRKLYAKLR